MLISTFTRSLDLFLHRRNSSRFKYCSL